MSNILTGILNEATPERKYSTSKPVALKESQNGISASDLADILYNRLEMRYPDIVTRYGHEVVGDIVMDVADFHAGAEELGTSDVSIMIRQILKKLENYNVDESKEVDYGDDYQNMVKRVGQLAKEGPRKTVYDPVKRVYKTVPVNPPQNKGVAEGYLPDESEMKTVYRAKAPDGNQWEVKEYQGDYLTFVNGEHNNTYHATRGMPYGAKDRAIEVVRRMAKQGVAEAGNKPVEKSRFGMGDTRTPRDIKNQMSGASDEFVKSTADKTTGPFHSKVAKMQGKMAKSELRKRDDHDRMATGTNEGIMNKIANKVMGAAPEQPKYKVGQRVKYETSPHQPDWKDGGRGVGVITDYKNGHYMINGNPVNHFEIKGVVEQGVAEARTDKNLTEPTSYIQVKQLIDKMDKGGKKRIANALRKNLGITTQDQLDEKWSQKYKSSINCSHPKGFSQKAHCAGKKKHNESIEMEMVCEDCGMCETHGDHSKDKLDELKCWPGHHRVAGTKAGAPGSCEKNKTNEEGVAEGWKDVVAGGAMALGALGANAHTMPNINAQQVELANKYYNVLVQRAKEDGTQLDTRTLNLLKAKAQDAAAKKTQQSTHQQGFPSLGSERRVAKDAGQFESQGVTEEKCPHCSGPMFSELMINEKKDACYYKVKSRYKVWPSAYASGALVKCRKKGAANWGNSSKNESIEEDQVDETLRDWFKEKWVRFGPDGKIRGACARGDDSEGKPKCLPQSKAHSLGKKGRASAASRKRREDPNPERSGKAINVNTKKKSNEGVAEEFELAGVDVAYELGRKAYKQGMTIRDNPYSATKEARKYDEWEKGLERGKWDAIEARKFRNNIKETKSNILKGLM